MESPTGSSAASGRNTPATRRKLVSRLLGMETEYATLVVNPLQCRATKLPTSSEVYASLCAAIRREQPTVRGVFDEEQMFLANGGAVTFETHPSQHRLPGGLVEIATPEVSSPDELLACQRSIDQMVADAAAEFGNGTDLRVLKNNTDALGHVYGCQENYEAVVATGVWLLIYRSCVCLLWMLQVISLVFALPVLAILFSILLLMRIRQNLLARRAVTAQSSEHVTDAQTTGERFESLPGWVKGALMGMLRVVHTPTVFVLRLVVRHVAFRKQRKYLTAMLVSRVALCGAGDLDHEGRYRLSPKAMAIDVIADMGSYNGERPIYVYGHWLQQFCANSFLSLGSTRAMFGRRQRFQIGLSDSNLSELAEYVKLGSVSLVLDMIESGQTKRFLTLSRPILALHAIASDWNLVRHVMTNRGRLSALEIQRHYWKAASEFVEQADPEVRGEADLVIRRWREVLDVVQAFRRDARNVTPALGRVDWLSKRWMIDQLGDQADWAARKKTDLRYHELSAEGYYQKLAAANPSLTLIHPDRIERRRRTPPPDSPAAKRGWVIREFGDGDESVTAEWSFAMLGHGKAKRRIDFGPAATPRND